jgi:hypothetical protein
MTPTVTTFLLQQLLDSPAENPVLYVNLDGDEPALDVWAGAYVSHGAVVTTRADLIDSLGDDWSSDDLKDCATDLQETADEVLATLAR